MLRWRALHRWADPPRSQLLVAALLAFALAAALLPLNVLFAAASVQFFAKPLWTRRGLSRAVQDEYLDMVLPARTHGNVHVAALRRRVDRGLVKPPKDDAA